MDLARQPDLDDEADRRHPEPDLGEEGGDRIGVAGALRDASAAMFSCCSMMAAPIDAKLITSAMICRCVDARSSWNASAGADALLLLADQRRIRSHALAPMITRLTTTAQSNIREPALGAAG